MSWTEGELVEPGCVYLKLDIGVRRQDTLNKRNRHMVSSVYHSIGRIWKYLGERSIRTRAGTPWLFRRSVSMLFALLSYQLRVIFLPFCNLFSLRGIYHLFLGASPDIFIFIFLLPLLQVGSNKLGTSCIFCNLKLLLPQGSWTFILRRERTTIFRPLSRFIPHILQKPWQAKTINISPKQ